MVVASAAITFELDRCSEAPLLVVLLSTKIWKLPVPEPACAAFTTRVQALPTMLKMPPGEDVLVVAVDASAPMLSRPPVSVITPLETEAVPLSRR